MMCDYVRVDGGGDGDAENGDYRDGNDDAMLDT